VQLPNVACVPTFLPGVPEAHVRRRLELAGGKEIESGKLASPESSAALAVNTFGWFVDRPQLLPPLPCLAGIGTPKMVDVEYCARFPWHAGRHPWLDAVVETPTHLVGVESKRYEPYRDRKAVYLSEAYDRPVWGDAMEPFERMRDRLRSGEERFAYLVAAQLVKHAFGLVTDGRRRQRQPALFYLFAEPLELGGKRIPPETFEAHRAEVTSFAQGVEGAEVMFAAESYRGWLQAWDAAGSEVAGHAQRIVSAFHP
jgi:hypothetical protein